METSCDSCKILMKEQDDKSDWFKQITTRNTELVRRVREQDLFIELLQKKIDEHTECMLSHEAEQLKVQILNAAEVNCVDSKKDPICRMEAKVKELEDDLKLMRDARMRFEENVGRNVKLLSDEIYALNVQIDFYEKCMYEETKKAGNMKKYCISVINEVAQTSEAVAFTMHETQEEKMKILLKKKYNEMSKDISNEKERLTRQVQRLQNQNRSLVLEVYGQKKKLENLQKVIAGLNSTIAQLSRKPDAENGTAARVRVYYNTNTNI